MPLAAKVSVLIVDDDPRLRYLLHAAAERSGLFEPIVVVEDGQAALEVLQAAAPESLPTLIVTDLSMPRMNGMDLVRAIKGNPGLRRLPIAVITSSDVPNDREVALAAGVCAFVPKPYGLEALTQTLLAIRDSCLEPGNPENSRQVAARNLATS